MKEYEIRYEGKYMGRWIEGDEQVRLQFTPENLRIIDGLDGLEQLTIGVALMAVGTFKTCHLDKKEITVDPLDSSPTTWSVHRAD